MKAGDRVFAVPDFDTHNPPSSIDDLEIEHVIVESDGKLYAVPLKSAVSKRTLVISGGNIEADIIWAYEYDETQFSTTLKGALLKAAEAERSYIARNVRLAEAIESIAEAL